MVILAAHQAASKVILREISSLNSGMCQVMSDTKIAGLYSILRLTASSILSSWLAVFAILRQYIFSNNWHVFMAVHTSVKNIFLSF